MRPLFDGTRRCRENCAIISRTILETIASPAPFSFAMTSSSSSHAVPGPAGTDAVKTIYQDHLGWLRGWFTRRLSNSQDAEDLAQDAFARIVAGRHRLDLSQPRALLTTIGKGLVADHFRRRALEQAFLEGLAALPEPELPSTEEQAIVLETLQAVDRMLDGLPGKVRRAFLLSRLDGHSYEAIANELGVSLSSVQKYLAQALMACYRALYDGGA